MLVLKRPRNETQKGVIGLNANKLRGVMAERRCTQVELAEAIGITPTAFGRKLNGKSCFDTVEAIKICEHLKISDPAEKAAIFLSNPS